MALRNGTIDIAKGIGIILVVLGHSALVHQNDRELFRVIFSFHMPLFFFLSGVFLRPTDSLRSFLLSRADSLLKPYFIVLLSIGAVKLAINAVEPMDPADRPDAEYFAGILYGTGKTTDWVPMWFLPHLFLTSTFSLLILKAMRSLPTYVVCAAAAVLLVVGAYSAGTFWEMEPLRLGFIELDRLPGLPWSVDLLPLTSAFMLFGHVLSRPVQSVQFAAPAFLMALASFCGLHYLFNETIDLNYREFGRLRIATAQAVLGIYLTLSVSALIETREALRLLRGLLTFAGKGSLFILIFHPFCLGKSFPLALRFTPNEMLCGVISVIAGIALPLVIWEVTRRTPVLALLLLPLRRGARAAV